jgi:hypothetical protein
MRTESYGAMSDTLGCDAAGRVKLVGNPISTRPWEIQWMVEKARYLSGNICEVGVFQGETTLEFASAYPDRKVFAVDLPKDDVCKFFTQMTWEKVCSKAKHLPNVDLRFEGNSFTPTLEMDIRFVFIDGDHSWEGVRRDTEKFIGYFRSTGRNGIIVWHDYYPQDEDWGMKVYDYLNALSAAEPILHVANTSLCYLNL